MKTIVALIDYSDVTDKVLEQAKILGRALDSDVVLMHIVPAQPVVVDFVVAPTVMEPPSAAAVQADQARLKQLQDALGREGVRTTSRQFQGASLEALLDECRLLNTDLIIVGSHGHGPLYNLLIGSVTAEVLKQAACPVLVVPAPPKAGPEA